MWRFTQTRPCDGKGCCSHYGLFSDNGFLGPCRYWTGTRCRLMLYPGLHHKLTPAERRAYAEKCVYWPIPLRVASLDAIYTSAQRKVMKLEPEQGCCYSWERLTLSQSVIAIGRLAFRCLPYRRNREGSSELPSTAAVRAAADQATRR